MTQAKIIGVEEGMMARLGASADATGSQEKWGRKGGAVRGCTPEGGPSTGSYGMLLYCCSQLSPSQHWDCAAGCKWRKGSLSCTGKGGFKNVHLRGYLEQAEQWVEEPAEEQDERSGAGRLTGVGRDLGGVQMWARGRHAHCPRIPRGAWRKRLLGKPGLVN